MNDSERNGTGRNKPLFSIVTVTLNPGADLAPTVASVLCQRYADFEFLLKDGGSTDGSLDGVPQDPRIRVVSQLDSGIHDAMNQALSLAKGRWIHFLNAGDRFPDPDTLAVVNETAERSPDAAFLYGDVYKEQSRSGIVVYPARLSRRFLFMNGICHQAWFVRRELYEQYGGFETEAGGAGADARLCLKMLVRDRVPYGHVPRPVAIYKGGGHSTSPAYIETSIKRCDALRREIYSRVEYVVYSLLRGLQTTLKRMLYDTLLHRPWAFVQRIRFGCAADRSKKSN